MNTRDFHRFVRLRMTSARQGGPLGETTRRAPGFPAKLVLGEGEVSGLHKDQLQQEPTQ